MSGSIYKATNIINGKSYIGRNSNNNIWARKTAHLSKVRTNKTPQAIHYAIKKYGEENFKWTILAENIESQEELDSTEIFYIAFYGSFGKHGYNMTIGGGGASGYKHTPEQIENNRLRALGNTNRLGSTHTPEANEKNRKSHLGFKHTVEAKRKISEALRVRVITTETREKLSTINKGKKLSEETKKKISEAQKGKKLSEEHKQNISKAGLGSKRKIVKCPHCNKVGGQPLMTRYHFGNCKTLK